MSGFYLNADMALAYYEEVGNCNADGPFFFAGEGKVDYVDASPSVAEVANEVVALCPPTRQRGIVMESRTVETELPAQRECRRVSEGRRARGSNQDVVLKRHVLKSQACHKLRELDVFCILGSATYCGHMDLVDKNQTR